MGDQGTSLRTELHSLEELLTQSKGRLDVYRRDLLSQVRRLGVFHSIATWRTGFRIGW